MNTANCGIAGCLAIASIIMSGGCDTKPEAAKIPSFAETFAGISCSDKLSVVDKATVDALRAFTDKRIAEIRATPNMAIPAGAACRYISGKNGNDSADGMSPATAWKTSKPLAAAKLAPGSFVLFERGGLYRNPSGIQISKGVTYTAYGSGAKPVLCTSPEDGANAAKWEKTDVPGVWAYQIGNRDVGSIVFNHGEAHAIKIMPIYNEDGSYSQTFGALDFNISTNSFNNGYRDLIGDLHFWHDYSDKTRFKPLGKGTGKLYLKSEKNPGERFKSIEFLTRSNCFTGSSPDVTIDNLCIKYVGAHGVGTGTTTNLTVRNCEFGWIGGSIQMENMNGRKSATRFGNAVEIYGGCQNFLVENCYIYQVYDAGITQQYGIPQSNGAQIRDQNNMRYLNNVIENCNYSIEYFLSHRAVPENPSRMNGFLIEGNLMWNSGAGFCEQRQDHSAAAHIKSWCNLCNRATNYAIRNNLMAFGAEMLMEISSGLKNPDGSDSMPKVENNLFIGKQGQRFGVLNQGKPEALKYDDALPSVIEKFGAGNKFTGMQN